MFIKKTILELLSIASTLSKIGGLKNIAPSKIWDIIEVLDIVDETIKKFHKIKDEKIATETDKEKLNREINELALKEIDIPKKDIELTFEELEGANLSINEIRQINSLFTIKKSGDLTS